MNESAREGRSPAATYDVVVIGAGQAGLAIGYFLKQQGQNVVILEAADSIGPAWRDRWESLRLFTPRGYSGLPGLPFPGDPDGYADRDEVIAYLERYAKTFELPIELNSAVRRLTRENGPFVLEVDGRRITAEQVVVATGPFQKPFIPEVGADSRRTSFRRTARATANPRTCPQARCSSSVAATPASRSPRSSRPRAGLSSPSARGRRRSRNDCSAEISSGG